MLDEMLSTVTVTSFFAGRYIFYAFVQCLARIITLWFVFSSDSGFPLNLCLFSSVEPIMM